MLVLKGAIKDENLLTTDVDMRLEHGVWRPTDESDMFCAEFMQRHNA